MTQTQNQRVPVDADLDPETQAAGPRWNEADRLAALARYDILDTTPEEAFDDIARLAADICEAPIAVVNLVAEGRQWFKAEIGLGVRETPLDISICAKAILQPGLFVVPDLTGDVRFSCNPLVTGQVGLRFYAGALLETPDGLPLGTLCVLDTQARQLSDKQAFALQALARQVMTQLELRRALQVQHRDAQALRTSEESRRENEELLRHVIDNLPVLIAFVDRDLRYRFNNKVYESWFGHSPEELYGRHISAAIGDEFFQDVIRPKVEAALAGERVSFEWTPPHAPGLRYFRSDYVPRREVDGSIGGFYVLVTDLTARRKAEQALRETEERYRIAARATNDAIWDWNLITDQILWNEAVYALFGHAGDQVGESGEWWLDHIHPEDRARVHESIQAAIEGSTETWSSEYRFRRSDGSYAFILDRGYVLRNGQGRAVRMIGAMLDLTERKRAEEHQKLLAGELQHRIKNTLAMVQSIANQTMRNAGSLAEARTAFGARLLALSHAHDVLTESSWAAAPIATVVEGALAPHQTANANRIRAEGPMLQLEAKPAMALALALHELATNAVKYGALSNDSGVVELLWTCEPGPDCETFRLTWREQGGPPVTPPSQKGFGTRLIERGLAGEFGGTVSLSYEPAGVVCTIEAPLPKAVP